MCKTTLDFQGLSRALPTERVSPPRGSRMRDRVQERSAKPPLVSSPFLCLVAFAREGRPPPRTRVEGTTRVSSLPNTCLERERNGRATSCTPLRVHFEGCTRRGSARRVHFTMHFERKRRARLSRNFAEDQRARWPLRQKEGRRDSLSGVRRRINTGGERKRTAIIGLSDN